VRFHLGSHRRLSITTVFAAAISLAGVITTTQAAQAAAPQILTFANKCVNVSGGQTGNGTLINEWTCNGTVSQNFTIVPLGNGFSTIKTAFGTCVDVRGGQTGNGTLIDEWGCNGTVSQEFNIIPLGNGFSTIKTAFGTCVDVNGAGTGDGTRIDEWGCNGTVAQEFVV
jgi:hypothetical protein